MLDRYGHFFSLLVWNLIKISLLWLLHNSVASRFDKNNTFGLANATTFMHKSSRSQVQRTCLVFQLNFSLFIFILNRNYCFKLDCVVVVAAFWLAVIHVAVDCESLTLSRLTHMLSYDIVMRSGVSVLHYLRLTRV